MKFKKNTMQVLLIVVVISALFGVFSVPVVFLFIAFFACEETDEKCDLKEKLHEPNETIF